MPILHGKTSAIRGGNEGDEFASPAVKRKPVYEMQPFLSSISEGLLA
jgi:hypothetical protein